jgi:5-methylcytosine-specific restriction enzyme A
MARLSGAYLNKKWGVNARHALYHRDGKWFEVLKRFPGALFDPGGYVLFESERQYKTCPQLRITKKTNVRGAIVDIPSYVRVAR